MLYEILCDKFITEGKPRGPITFHDGLNVVQGHNTGENSIGKSTFLLVIDFAFGGNDYVNETSITNHVGHHTVKFCFKFGDKLHRFSRSTDNKNEVALCDETYTPTETIGIEEFCIRLKALYKISLTDITFRNIISRYFRIYNRETSDEHSPLAGWKGESDRDSLIDFLQLHDAYAVIKEHHEEIRKKQDYKKAVKAAGSQKVVTLISSEKAYKENLEEIDRLQIELEHIARYGKDDLLNRTEDEAKQAAEHKAQHESLVRQRKRLWSQWHTINNASKIRRPASAQDFQELLRYFPDSNITELSKIESFHSRLSSILQEEFSASMASILALIDETNRDIAIIEATMKELDIVGRSVTTLESYASVRAKIKVLQDQNDLYLELDKVSDEIKVTNKTFTEIFMQQVAIIEGKVNPSIAQINADIYGENSVPPVLHITSPTSYSYGTPSDGGTGTNWKNLIFLDMAMLEFTQLPAIAHDTIVFKHIDRVYMSRVLEKYSGLQNKQAFIAFDSTITYVGNAQNIIKDKTVLNLSDGNELFGSSWAKRSSATE